MRAREHRGSRPRRPSAGDRSAGRDLPDAGPVFPTRRGILLAQLAAGLCFAAHYSCLGIPVASAANLLGSVQTLAALFATRSTAMAQLGHVLIALMALAGLAFWQGPVSALSVVAMTLIAFGRMQANETHLRVLLLAGGAFWLLHDVTSAAWIAAAADLGAVLTGGAALCALLFRVTIEWRPLPPAAAAA